MVCQKRKKKLRGLREQVAVLGRQLDFAQARIAMMTRNLRGQTVYEFELRDMERVRGLERQFRLTALAYQSGWSGGIQDPVQ